METVFVTLLIVVVLEIAGVGAGLAWLSLRSERGTAAQLEDFRRTQALSEEERKIVQVAAAHGMFDAASLGGTLQDAEAVYRVQQGTATVEAFVDALCKTTATRTPSVISELTAYVDARRESRHGIADRVQ
ncbi:MAG: hypothetical protein ACYDA9_14060 [Terriglobia bacterium]